MSKKILVIDDSPTIVAILTSLLDEGGYEVISTGKPAEGVRKAAVEKPDLIIIDTVMPLMDGFEVCRIVRGAASGAGGPKIIMMSGSVDAADEVKARRLGADDYVAKTADLSTIVTAVNNLLGAP